MRLTCPNCAAQYEIDGAMIPQDGRDVQCSACGHAWLQRPDIDEADAAEPMPGGDAAGLGRDDDAAGFGREDDAGLGRDDAGAPPAAPAMTRAKPMTDKALEILKEEATRETEARRRDAGGRPDRQPDPGPGPEDGPRIQARSSTGRARLKRLTDDPAPPAPRDEPPADRAEDDAPPVPAAGTGGDGAVFSSTRRGALPDIEEINSTLTAAKDRPDRVATDEEIEQARARSGFRVGFFAVFTVLLAMIMVYLLAPQIAQAVPALTPPLSGYLDWSNDMLDMVDGWLRSGVAAMNDTAAEITGD